MRGVGLDHGTLEAEAGGLPHLASLEDAGAGALAHYLAHVFT